MTSQQQIFLHRLQSALFYWLWLPGLVIGSGLAFDHWLGLHRLQHGIMANTLALLLLGSGLALIAWSERDLKHIGHGTPSPAQPTKRLVTSGSYQLCRHPMFLGYNLAGLAVIFFTGSPAMLVVGFPLMLVWQVRFLRQEEHILALRFSKDYPIYQATVSFLVPFFHAKHR